MGGAPAITPDAYLAALTKWEVNWRFYSTKADWLTHNRNFKNTDLVDGGWAPEGVGAHNTASTAQAGMLDYLYRGDPLRGLPGPLANVGVLKTGEAVLLGWGTSNATGPGDPVGVKATLAGTLPMDRELVPTTSGPSDPRAVRVAPFLFGIEGCYASEGPTPEQRDAMVRYVCACLDVMGKTAGSVVMHRELTTTRSDPQGFARNAEFRRLVAARLAAGPALEDDMALTPAQETRLNQAVDRILGAVPEGAFLTRLDGEKKTPRILDSGDGGYIVALLKSVAEKVGAPVDVDEAAIGQILADTVGPQLVAAVLANLPAETGLTAADVETAVRTVLRTGVDTPPPA